MYNTIILKHGEGNYTKKQFQEFTEGSEIFGNNSEPEEVKRWTIDQEEEAREELKKYKCSYEERFGTVYAEEYGLEFCETDEDGEVIDGSDFELAETEYKAE